MTFEDHFFGTLYRDGDTGEVSVALSQVLGRARLVNAVHFTAQLRRLLGQQRYLRLSDHTSAPNFPALLQALQAEDIGPVRLARRQDLSEGFNLTCFLVFVEGLVEVRAYWTGYKELRAFELVQTLLRPLVGSGLATRTLLDQGDQDTRLEQEPEALFRQVMAYHGEPYSELGYGKIADYVNRLQGIDPLKAAFTERMTLLEDGMNARIRWGSPGPTGIDWAAPVDAVLEVERNMRGQVYRLAVRGVAAATFDPRRHAQTITQFVADGCALEILRD